MIRHLLLAAPFACGLVSPATIAAEQEQRAEDVRAYLARHGLKE